MGSLGSIGVLAHIICNVGIEVIIVVGKVISSLGLLVKSWLSYVTGEEKLLVLFPYVYFLILKVLTRKCPNYCEGAGFEPPPPVFIT